ncbi:aldo/keto reductase [Palleronia abyssalis]|uniref:General stress protein 69 n=1 Tax=Palleronia abyssalis TaxID=1501240 RepID=A0A2R8BXP5_9RHOB|nr:aldo/keto reductase [Palleronia abyssalis]SPJ24892.1 General stress protein 69 [Palleronia abyssalis]
MQTRQLGLTGLEIAPIVFGGNVFGWTADTPTSHALIDQFLDRGFNAIDSADVYSAWAPGNEGGESERVIGDWLQKTGRRDEMVLMTKVGMWGPREGLRAQNIEKACEDSLKRLNTDHIDVYFAHRDDTDTPLEETLEAFAKLKQAGKIRHAGASNYDADRLAQAVSAGQGDGKLVYEVFQPEYNLVARDYEGAQKDVALKHGMGVVTYFSLASGFLTGKYRDKSDIEGTEREAMLGGYFEGKGKAVLDALLAVSDEVGAKPAQVALAWLIQRDGVTAPIASARNPGQLAETLGAADLTLAEDQMNRLTKAGA